MDVDLCCCSPTVSSTTPPLYCTDRKTVDYSKQVDFAVLLRDGNGGLQTGGAVAVNALQGSPAGGLNVAVDHADLQSIYSLAVRILDQCPSSSSWMIVHYAFTIRGAREIQIVIGDVVVMNWTQVSSSPKQFDVNQVHHGSEFSLYFKPNSYVVRIAELTLDICCSTGSTAVVTETETATTYFTGTGSSLASTFTAGSTFTYETESTTVGTVATETEEWTSGTWTTETSTVGTVATETTGFGTETTAYETGSTWITTETGTPFTGTETSTAIGTPGITLRRRPSGITLTGEGIRPLAEGGCTLTHRTINLLLPSGLRCSPAVDVELTACSGVCGTSFVEGSIVFSGEVVSPNLRGECNCCRGQGTWRNATATCSGQTVSFTVYTIESCFCEPCITSV